MVEFRTRGSNLRWDHPWPLGHTGHPPYTLPASSRGCPGCPGVKSAPILISYSNFCPLGRATEQLLQVIHKFCSISRVYCYFKNEFWFIVLQQKPNF